MSRASRSASELLLGEWACLGVIAEKPSHGFAVATRLAPTGDLGRIWSLSRPLTYRAIDQLIGRGYIETRGEEPGIAGGQRTVLRITRSGRAALNAWLTLPVPHLRDLRSELLLKLEIGRQVAVQQTSMLKEQRRIVDGIIRGLEKTIDDDDIVTAWRVESAEAARRFLDRLG